MDSKRLFIFDFLRLLAILLVVLSHILRMENLDEVRGYLGIIGLGTFFFVSGYLLVANEKPISIHNIIPYFKKRFVRIYPLYWVALILSILLSWLLANYFFNWPTIIAYLCGVQSVFVPKYMAEISSYWFIGTILIYYLLFPLITSGKKTYSILLISFPIFIFLMIIRIYAGLFDGRVFEYFFVFVLGIIASRLQFFDTKYFPKWKITSAVVSVICIGIVIIYRPMLPSDLSQISPLLLFIVGLVTTFRIILIISSITAVYWIITLCSLPSSVKRIITAGAMASYAVYLFHDSYYSIFYHVINLTDVAVRNVAGVLALPILFVICYYIQLTADKLFMKQTPIRLV